MFKYLRFGLMFPMLVVSLVGLVMGGPWMWLGLGVCGTVMVAGDELLPDEPDMTVYAYPQLLNLFLFFSLPFIAVNVLVLVWMVGPSGDALGLAAAVKGWTGWDMLAARERTGALDVLGGMLSTMLLIGIACVNVAHELMHRNNGLMRSLGKVLDIFSFDVPTYITHVQGHHLLVGLPEDPSTSFRGESVYAFILRAIYSANAFAMRLEVARMRRMGRSAFSWHNRFLQGHAMSVAATVFAYWISGWRGPVVFIATALLGKALLEAINYIQHYGLVRVQGTPIAPHHSWNSNKRITGYMLLNASRHSSHHMNPQHPFWLMEPMPGAPTLHFGYLTSVLVTLVPPLWHRLMMPELIKWDSHYATLEERKLAAEQNRRSGLPLLMAAG